MIRIALFLILCLNCLVSVCAQQALSLGYYLPNIAYNPSIPTPQSWLGYQVGEYHASHDQLLGYMRALAASSDRIKLEEYGRSHENRPLICLTISDPSNVANLDKIQSQRQALTDPDLSKKLRLEELPAVNYMGYSIHGNETSGSNAALLVAYYLAAGQSDSLKLLLKNTVILFDPCFNPDGMQRFSTWVNSHKSKNNTADPADDEYNEPWPRGRTNHYGFDLNRDWLVAQQPESKGRVALFQKWKPNVLTDHHEMGSNATFFFQPGVASRVNPITPLKNQELTAKIGGFHAKILNQNKVLYYSGENFDDYYYGKGSTYPDVQGAIGILFEQGSSRGTAQETENGLLTFPYSIRNQVFTSLSTLKAVGEMRLELNRYLREFYQTAVEEARKSDIKGYLFECRDLPGQEFTDLLQKQGIQVQGLQENLSSNGKNFQPNTAYFVPCEQPQYRLVRAIFERPTTFSDSIFYDISTWTLPDAFGLEWAPVLSSQYSRGGFQEPIKPFNSPIIAKLADEVPYAYVIRPEPYELPKLLVRLLKTGLRVRVAMKPFAAEGNQYRSGTIVIAADRQTKSAKEFTAIMNEMRKFGLPIDRIESGLTTEGPDIGSNNFEVLREPKILMLTGDGVSVAESGEIWHQLDTRYDIPITLVQTNRLSNTNLSKYNVLIMPDGSYNGVSVEKLRQFAVEGGTIIATGKALNWLKANGLAPVEFKKSAISLGQTKPYGTMSEDKAAYAMPGAIFEARLDLTHPLCFGYTKNILPVFFSDTLFVSAGKNPYSTPVAMTQKPLLSGYVHAKVLPQASNSAAAIVYGLGRGKVICFPGNPNFRAFWYGTNRLFANAVFFGNLISSESTEQK